MEAEARERYYRAQTGGRITPRQRRRGQHKINRVFYAEVRASDLAREATERAKRRGWRLPWRRKT